MLYKISTVKREFLWNYSVYMGLKLLMITNIAKFFQHSAVIVMALLQKMLHVQEPVFPPGESPFFCMRAIT